MLCCGLLVRYALQFMEMDAEKYRFGLNSKFMGQVNLVLLGRDQINDNGSFTLNKWLLK